MRFLDEHQRRPARLADHLPWAALVAPGVILNKDGAFTAAFAFRGPDLESSEDEELMAVRARLNNALRRLGSGWCLHLEARRRPADPYPVAGFDLPAPALVDAERRRVFEEDDPAFETDFRCALTWLPPADRARRLERWMFDGLDRETRDWPAALDLFRREAAVLFDLFADALPQCEPLDDTALLTWLHDTVSDRTFGVVPPQTPMFLDALLADAPLTGGIAPRLGAAHLRVVSVRSLPAATRPGHLDALGQLPFGCRWTTRWIPLDKADAEAEIGRLRRRWFAKRKGLGVLLREAVTKEETPLIDTDARAKTEECDGALEALGAEVCGYGFVTTTVTVLASDAETADARARQVEAVLNARGCVARLEDLNAVEAWLGSLPGEPYADVRRPLVSSLNLADLMPASALWSGPAEDAHLGGPPLMVARTTGGAPFRLSLHVEDVGHAMVVGPTGAGKSVLLAFLALQWFRYPEARVVAFDKGRSLRAVAEACGGRWLPLRPGAGMALQPLVRLEQASDRAWAAEWLLEAVERAGVEATPSRREAIWSALSALAGSPQDQRTLTVLRALVQEPEVAAALEPLTLDGPWGDLLDGAAGDPAESRFACFEMEDLMAASGAAAAVLTALFRTLERSFDGRPTLLLLDEAWLFLDATVFATRIREWLKTLRKKNVAVVFATQSLDDVAASAIAPALIENCPTQIFLPNPRALEPGTADLYRRFGLNRRQLQLIARASPRRSYYLRQPHGRRLFDLKLSGAGLALCGAGSPEDQRLLEAVLERAPAAFLPEFLKAKGVFDGLQTAPSAPPGP